MFRMSGLRKEKSRGGSRITRSLPRAISVFPLNTFESNGPYGPDERRKLAGAFGFSGKIQLNEEEQQLLEFLMENGNPDVWRAIALVVARHDDQSRALDFLLARVKDETEHLANYYQALAILSDPECVPILARKLSAHRREIDPGTTPTHWGEPSIYSDYLCCSATLLRITGQEEYRSSLKKTLEHPDETVREKVRVIAATYGFEI